MPEKFWKHPKEHARNLSQHLILTALDLTFFLGWLLLAGLFHSIKEYLYEQLGLTPVDRIVSIVIEVLFALLILSVVSYVVWTGHARVWRANKAIKAQQAARQGVQHGT